MQPRRTESMALSVGAESVSYMVPHGRYSRANVAGSMCWHDSFVIVSTDPHKNDIMMEHLTEMCTHLCDFAATRNIGIRHGGEQGLAPRPLRIARRCLIVIKPGNLSGSDCHMGSEMPNQVDSEGG